MMVQPAQMRLCTNDTPADIYQGRKNKDKYYFILSNVI